MIKESDREKYKCVRNKVVAIQDIRFATNKDFWKEIKVINKEDSTLRDGDTFKRSQGRAPKVLVLQMFLSFFSSTQQLCSTRYGKLFCLYTLHRETILGDFKIHWSRWSICLRASTIHSTPRLAKLFNLSLTSGSFPSEWKCASDI